MKKIYGVFIVVLTVLSFVNCTAYASGEKPEKVKELAKKQVDIGPVRKISDSPYHVIGLKDAPIVMLDFYSLTCPACADFHGDAFPEILKNYVDTGQLKIQLYDFITDQVAMIGSKVSRCLPEDLYLKFTKFLMAEQEGWAYSQNPVEELKKRAKIFGISDEKFDHCLNDRTLNAQLLDAQKLMTKEANITHTPTFIFQKNGQPIKDGKVIQGNQDLKTIQAVINSYLK